MFSLRHFSISIKYRKQFPFIQKVLSRRFNTDFPFLFVKYGPFLPTFPDDDMGNPCRNVEVITKKFWKERNCLHTGNFIFVVVGAVDEVFFLPKGKEWKMDKI